LEEPFSSKQKMKKTREVILGSEHYFVEHQSSKIKKNLGIFSTFGVFSTFGGDLFFIKLATFGSILSLRCLSMSELKLS
jgi:hypothetical protein